MSLRARMVAGIAFVALALGAVSAYVAITTNHRLMDQIDRRLELYVPARPDNGRPPTRGGGGEGRDAVTPERLSEVYQGYVTSNGVLVTQFMPNIGSDHGVPDIDAEDLPASGRRIFTTSAETGSTTYRVVATRDGSVVEIAALPIDDVQRTISQLVAVEIVGSLTILVALVVVAWWMLRLGIRPVKEMTEVAARIAEGELNVRVPIAAGGTEPAQLGAALNHMLTRIQLALDEQAASQERLRRFVADASHELRTPVTTIRGYAELYRLGGLADAARLDDAMRRTEAEAARIGRLVDDMLRLAKLDERRPLRRDRVDLAVLARDAAADARAVAPARTITVRSPESACITGDEDALRQVFANVVGNAIVHTHADITLSVCPERDGVSVQVADDGDGMVAEDAQRATERFYRADPGRSRHRGGSGLGLAIVDAAVAAHGGTTTVESSPGCGTRVELRFPMRCGSEPRHDLLREAPHEGTLLGVGPGVGEAPHP